MDHKLEKHPEYDFYILKISGEVLPGDLVEMLKELWAVDLYISQTHIMWDFSLSDTNCYFNDIFQLFQFVQQNKQDRGPKTLAVFAPDDTEYGMSRMYATLNESSNPKVMVFRERDKAEKWLLEN